MKFWEKWFVEVKHGTKVTYSESDLNKLDRMYETEVIEKTDRKVMSPFRKEPQRAFLAQVRDYAFEKILDSHLYTFKHLLVIPNPYGLAKQTAYLLFNSSKEYKVRYRVIGDDGEDFIGETELTKRHRVAIMGLYLERSNQVELSLLDAEDQLVKHRTIRIYVSETPPNLKNIVTDVINKKVSQFPFMLVNGATFNPMAVDANGAIRYSLQLRTNRMGMIPLQNGHVLFADRTANCVNRLGEIQPCRYHEMDYMGRVYRTFILKDPISTVITQYENSLYLVTSSDKEHINDCIIELDMNSGEVVKSCDLGQILGEKYRNTRDWTMLSCLEYHQGSLLVTLKRLHTVMNLRWEDGSVEWLLAPEGIWEDTPLHSRCLRHQDGEALLLGRPDSAVWENAGQISVFNTQVRGDIPAGYSCEDKSSVVTVTIEAEKGTYYQTEEISCVKNTRFGSALKLDGGKKIFFLQGFTKERTETKRAELTLVDRQSGKLENQISLAKIYLNAWKFNPDIASYSQSIETSQKTVFGSLESPAVFHGMMPQETEERLSKEYFSRPHMCDNLFLFAMFPGAVDKIYFIGNNNAYVQDYQRLSQGKRKEIFAIQVDQMEEDEYFLYLESQGVVHKLKNEIRIVR